MTEKEYKLEFGKQIEKYLKHFGLMNEDLAQLIKSNTTKVQNIINATRGLTYSKVIEIAMLFGVTPYNFVNPDYPLPNEEDLPEVIKKKIAERKIKGFTEREPEGLLAAELDKLIDEGILEKPATSKILYSLMDKELKDRSPSEITSLLNKEPRKNYICKLDNKLGREKVFIHKDFFDEYNHLSAEELKDALYKVESNEK